MDKLIKLKKKKKKKFLFLFFNLSFENGSETNPLAQVLKKMLNKKHWKLTTWNKLILEINECSRNMQKKNLNFFRKFFFANQKLTLAQAKNTENITTE